MTSTPTSAVSWDDAQRQVHFDHWLTSIAASQKLATDTLNLASADASFRRYLRIQTTEGIERIVMDAPPDKEPLTAFLSVQALLKTAGVQVPEILAHNAEHGFLLMNDLGHQTVLQYLAPNFSPETAYPLMLDALDWLIQMQLQASHSVPAYSQDILQRELQLFPDWYLGQYRGAQLNETQKNTIQSGFDTIVAHNLNSPKTFVHRDYMLRNLMVKTHQGTPQLSGLLDFQDALYGPITYDLASLLKDAFHSWEEDFVIDIAVRYWERARKAKLLASMPDWESDFGEFFRAVEWMGLQRHLKVAGIFARLSLRDGKPKYLADTPRFIQYIRGTASRYRELFPLLRVIDSIENTPTTDAFSFGRM